MVLPRINISPIVSPSAGTSIPDSISTIRIPAVITIAAPWRALSLALASASRSSQSEFQVDITV